MINEQPDQSNRGSRDSFAAAPGHYDEISRFYIREGIKTVNDKIAVFFGFIFIGSNKIAVFAASGIEYNAPT